MKLTQTISLSGVPLTVTITPTISQIPDTSPAGMVVATVTVQMSDGSPFTGELALTSDPADDLLRWEVPAI